MKKIKNESDFFSEVSQKIADGLDLDAPLDEIDSTYLHYASSYNYTEVISLLLNSGASVDKTIFDGDTALNMAANLGHQEAVELLISLGANINHQSADGGVTPLIDATINGHVNIVKTILKHKPNLDITDGLGQNALIIAINKDNLDIAQLLINAGIDINSPDLSNNYPITYAIFKGEYSLVESLIKMGARTDTKSMYGNNLLHDAVQNGSSKMLEISRKYFYTKINVKNLFGDTPVNHAYKTKNKAAVEIFIQDISKGAIPGINRNDTCPCGSGIKYKKCCLGQEYSTVMGNISTKRPLQEYSSIKELLEHQLIEIEFPIKQTTNHAIQLTPTINNKQNVLNQEVRIKEDEGQVQFITQIFLCEPHNFIEPVVGLAKMLNSISKYSMTSFSYCNGAIEYSNVASFDDLKNHKVILPQLINRNQYCIYKTLNVFNKLISFGKAFFTGIELFIDEFTPNKRIKKEIESQFNQVIGMS